MAAASSPAPRIADTAVRVIEAGQRVLLDRLDLARFDLGRLMALGGRALAAAALATGLLAGAWFALLAAAALLLHGALQWSLPACLALVAAVAAGAGIATVGLTLRRLAAFESTALVPLAPAPRR